MDDDDQAALEEVQALVEASTPDPRDLDGDGAITEADVLAVIALCTDPECTGSEPEGQVPGDCNLDRRLDLSDGICLLGFLFLQSPDRLPCGDGKASDPANRTLVDFNGDGRTDLSDAVSVFNFLFLGGAPHILGVQPVVIDGCPDPGAQ
jgi:hypothetical protein